MLLLADFQNLVFCSRRVRPYPSKMPAATQTPSEHWHIKMYTQKNNKGKNKKKWPYLYREWFSKNTHNHKAYQAYDGE